jgi:hypothetical protein
LFFGIVIALFPVAFALRLLGILAASKSTLAISLTTAVVAAGLLALIVCNHYMRTSRLLAAVSPLPWLILGGWFVYESYGGPRWSVAIPIAALGIWWLGTRNLRDPSWFDS